MKRILLLALIVIPFLGCEGYQEELYAEDLIFIGSWSSPDYYLEIAANGYGFCQRRNRNAVEGTVEITLDEIIFRDNNRRTDFYIDELPYEDRGEVMMVLDGDVFYRH